MCDRQPRDAGEGLDLLNHCQDKVEFLADVLTFGAPGRDFQLGEQAASGLFWILEDLERDMGEVYTLLRAALTGGRG